MFSASLRRCNGAKCWLYAFTDGKRGAEWVFVNRRLGFSTNAEKEQLLAAQAGPEKERAREGLARTPQPRGVAVVSLAAGEVGMRPRTGTGLQPSRIHLPRRGGPSPVFS